MEGTSPQHNPRNEFKIVKVKKCPCGNTLTLSARVASFNSSDIRIEGGINRDADDRVLCPCFKVHHFKAPIEKWINANQPNRRLAYLRGEIEAERISYGEIAELQSLAEFIDPADTLLLEWAGVPEKG